MGLYLAASSMGRIVVWCEGRLMPSMWCEGRLMPTTTPTTPTVTPPLNTTTTATDGVVSGSYRHAALGGVMGGGARGDVKLRDQFKDDEEAALATGMPVFVCKCMCMFVSACACL